MCSYERAWLPCLISHAADLMNCPWLYTRMFCALLFASLLSIASARPSKWSNDSAPGPSVNSASPFSQKLSACGFRSACVVPAKRLRQSQNHETLPKPWFRGGAAPSALMLRLFLVLSHEESQFFGELSLLFLRTTKKTHDCFTWFHWSRCQYITIELCHLVRLSTKCAHHFRRPH